MITLVLVLRQSTKNCETKVNANYFRHSSKTTVIITCSSRTVTAWHTVRKQCRVIFDLTNKGWKKYLVRKNFFLVSILPRLIKIKSLLSISMLVLSSRVRGLLKVICSGSCFTYNEPKCIFVFSLSSLLFNFKLLPEVVGVFRYNSPL